MNDQPDQPDQPLTAQTLRESLHALLIADQAEDDRAHAHHAALLEAAYPGSTDRIAEHLSIGRFTTAEALIWAHDPEDDALTVLTAGQATPSTPGN